MVKTSTSSARSEEGSTPGWGARILHAAWPKQTNHRSDIVTNSIKTLKKLPLKKRKKTFKKGEIILKKLISPVFLLLC